MVKLPNDGANDGFWRTQLRDRFGRFVEMGGPVSFEVQLPGVDGPSRGLGYFIGNTSLELARISVKDNLSVPQGVYEIAPDKITAIQAILKRDQLTKNPDGSVSARSGKTPTPTAEPLKDSISGAEVQKKKLKSITTMLKRQGRFAVPRQSNLDTWGKNSDVSLAAQADYKQVYEASAELQQLYDSAEDMWFRVFDLSVDTDTSSPNDLSKIPEEMKLLNREYAKHFLGLKEDGLITVYRNAVNGKDTEIDSAAGYVSTDMSLAYDYNSKKENIASNGRYEIDVKPDEVFGMLGYSKPEDEYAFVIGKGVTSQEGRVRRVGDLAPLPMPAPWLQQYEKDIQYSRGATPYRHHALAGQFNFHEVENFGNDLKEFFAKYNLTADDIKSTFDKLNGSGAYEEYRESGNTVSFNGIRDMFVDLPNGKIGLDITKISGGSSQGITFHSYGDASKPESYKNDRLDNTLKMLAVFQKLTGEPFFTHRSRDYVPELANTVPKLEFTPTEVEAIKWYTDQGHDELNKSLRDGAPISPEGELELESILGLIDRSPLENPMTVYRGRPVINPDRFAQLDALKPGDTLIDKGIMSTSYSKDQADFYAQMPLEKSLGKFMLEIDLPAGAKAFAIPDDLASYGDTDKEILLPPDMPLEVVDVTTDSSGLKTIKLKPATNKVGDIKTSSTPNIATNGVHGSVKDGKGQSIEPGTELLYYYTDKELKDQVKLTYTGYLKYDFDGNNIDTGLNYGIFYVEKSEKIEEGYYNIKISDLDINNGKGGSTPEYAELDSKFDQNAMVPDPRGLTELTKSEAESIFRYTKNSYKEINHYLETGNILLGLTEKGEDLEEKESRMKERIIEDIENLDNVIEKSTLLEDEDFYRGSLIPGGLSLEDFLNNLNSGNIEEWIDTRFTSTSSSFDIAEWFAEGKAGASSDYEEPLVIYKFRAKKGQTAYKVPNFIPLHTPNEFEALFPRGTKFKVVGHEYTEGDPSRVDNIGKTLGVIVVDLEMMVE